MQNESILSPVIADGFADEDCSRVIVIIRDHKGDITTYKHISDEVELREMLISTCGNPLHPEVRADIGLLAVVNAYEVASGHPFIPCANPGQLATFFIRRDVLLELGAIIPCGGMLVS